MTMFFWKLALLIINWIFSRKDKFSRAKDRLDRRKDYLESVKEVEQDEMLDEYEKRALKNGLAKAVCGSLHVNYEVLDYFYRSEKISNFENVTPIVSIWDNVLTIEKKKSGQIINIRLNEKKYNKEVFISTITLVIWLAWLAVVLVCNVGITKHFEDLLNISSLLSVVIYIVLLAMIGILMYFILYMWGTLLMVKDIIKRSSEPLTSNMENSKE